MLHKLFFILEFANKIAEGFFLCMRTKLVSTKPMYRLKDVSYMGFFPDYFPLIPVAYRGGVGEVWGGSNPLKFRSFNKAEPNSQFPGKYIHNNLIRIRVSPICKLSGTPD
jgi:hypothetical protein